MENTDRVQLVDWARNGKQIVFTVGPNRPGDFAPGTLYLWSIDDNRIVSAPYGTDKNLYPIQISPNGDAFGYISERDFDNPEIPSTLYLVSLTKQSVMSFPLSYADQPEVHWSPDGKFIAVMYTDRSITQGDWWQLEVYGVDGQAYPKLRRNYGVGGFMWSVPHTFTFLRPRKDRIMSLVALDAAIGKFTVIEEDTSGYQEGLANHQIAVVRNHGDKAAIVAMNPDGSDQHLLVDDVSGLELITKDGQHILYALDREGSQIGVVGVNGKNPHILIQDRVVPPILEANNGRSILYLTVDTNLKFSIKMAELNSRQSRTLAAGMDDIWPGPIAEDGFTFLYRAKIGEQLSIELIDTRLVDDQGEFAR
jgi:hypothetical protein